MKTKDGFAASPSIFSTTGAIRRKVFSIEMKEQAKKVLRIEADAVAALIDRIDERFEQAVRMILCCEGRVVVTGMGKSGLIGKKIAATLASTGTPALFLHPAEGIHGDLGMV